MSPKEEKKEFEKLFEEWKNQFDLNAFISDGIVDYERYEKPHILFVLREMNCKVENDLCENLREYGSGHKTWCNAGRWVKALLDGDTEHPYDMSSEKRAEQLLRVAVMNLKKEGGGSRVNGAELPHEWWYYYTAIKKNKFLLSVSVNHKLPIFVIAEVMKICLNRYIRICYISEINF